MRVPHSGLTEPYVRNGRYQSLSASAKERHLIRVREWQKNNPEKVAERGRRNQLKLKLDIIKLFGNKCAKCGITDHRVLSINHLHGQKGEKITGRKLWKAIISGTLARENFNLLCMNCQFIYEHERGRVKLPKTLTVVQRIYHGGNHKERVEI